MVCSGVVWHENDFQSRYLKLFPRWNDYVCGVSNASVIYVSHCVRSMFGKTGVDDTFHSKLEYELGPRYFEAAVGAGAVQNFAAPLPTPAWNENIVYTLFFHTFEGANKQGCGKQGRKTVGYWLLLHFLI